MKRKPLLLAVESSTRWLGAALLEGENALSSLRVEEPRSGSERLLPLIDEVLEESGATIDQVEAFAVSAGPGSFTGLRVGIATIKGLAFGRGAVAVPVSTLDALAHGAEIEEGVVVAALDAHRGELYLNVTRFEAGRASIVQEPRVVEVEALPPLLPAESPRVVWTGDAPHAAATLECELEIRSPPDGAPDPLWVGRLGARRIAAGEGVTPERLVPWYLRRAEAEALRTGEPFESPHNGG